jgi:hypothetical protein
MTTPQRYIGMLLILATIIVGAWLTSTDDSWTPPGRETISTDIGNGGAVETP